MAEPVATEVLGMCDCARTREFCVTQGCKKESFRWRYSTEGRDADHLRRVIELRHTGTRPVTRWIRPERAVAEAWLMNMQAESGTHTILKLGRFGLATRGQP